MADVTMASRVGALGAHSEPPDGTLRIQGWRRHVPGRVQARGAVGTLLSLLRPVIDVRAPSGSVDEPHADRETVQTHLEVDLHGGGPLDAPTE